MGTKEKQEWRVNRGTQVMMDNQDLQDFRAPWGCQENMVCLDLKEKLAPRSLRAYLA
jgi:hypothetical protein